MFRNVPSLYYSSRQILSSYRIVIPYTLCFLSFTLSYAFHNRFIMNHPPSTYEPYHIDIKSLLPYP